jgi:ribosomal protein L16 Arg81 hydroxylase
MRFWEMGKVVSDPLEKLIAPLDKRDFFLHYWGREYLISEGNADRFASLFSWDALGEILSTHRFDFPRLRLLSGGHVAPPVQYIVRKTDRRGNPYTTHDSDAVSRMLADGAMLHITSIGETWKPLAIFAAKLEPILGGKVQVNLHAGYAGSRGFHTHWDGHDVYAVQIDGCKKWRLFGFTEKAPLAVPPDQKGDAPTSRTWEGILGTGKMLYLPRGYWHATQFLDDPSLHLTFAVQHPTGIEFSRWLIEQLAQDLIARRDIPLPVFDMPDVGAAAREQYITEMRELVMRSFSPESIVKFLSEYRSTLGKTNHVQLTSQKE